MFSKIFRSASLVCLFALVASTTVRHSRASISEPGILNRASVRSPFELVGHIGGIAEAIEIQGSYAYVEFGPELVVFDLTDPYHPNRLGSILLPVIINDIAIAYPYAYIADQEAGLQIIAIADPANMVITGSASVPNGAYAVAVFGNYAYLGNGLPDMSVFDVSNPAMPQQVNNIPVPAIDIKIFGEYAYVAGSNSGLQILSLSDPASPEIVGQYAGQVISVTVAWPRVYVIFINSAGIVNVSDPANPYYAGDLSVDINGPKAVAVNDADVFVIGSTCYSDRCIGSLQVKGITNQIKPGQGRLDFLGYPLSVALYGNYLVVPNFTYGGFMVINVSNPKAPAIASQYHVPGNILGLDVSGEDAYTVMNGGIQAVDISNPAHPIPQGYASVFGEVHRVALNEGDAFVTVDYGGFRVIQTSDPSNLVEVGADSTTQDPWGVVTSGNYVYVGAYNGFRVEDVTVPTNPVTVGSCPFPGSIPVDIALRAPYAYTVKCDGLDVVDISNPMNPFVAALGPHGACTGGQAIVLSGDYAYLAHEGFQIINIADPTHPILENSLFWGDGIYDISIQGQLAYLATDTGLTLLDLTNLIQPVVVGSYKVATAGTAVKAVGGYIYLGDGYGGIYVFRLVLADITGRVTDASSNPVFGVTLSAGAGRSELTDAGGSYQFANLLSGDYTITPTLGNSVFYPPFRSVSVPPDTVSQNFILLPKPVQTTLTPGITTTLSFIDPQGSVTQVIIPGSAITETLEMTLAPAYTVGGGGFAFTGHAFDLRVARDGLGLPGFTFLVPISVTVGYSDWDVRAIPDKTGLALWWSQGAGWVDASQSCDPPSVYVRDPSTNVINLWVCRSGKFGLFGPTHAINLPLVNRIP